jgi:hypothetical protein
MWAATGNLCSKFPAIPIQCDHPDPDALPLRLTDLLRGKPGDTVAEGVRRLRPAGFPGLA